MGFLDKAKAAAHDLKSSVDQQMSSSATHRDAERHLRDLGLLAYLKETGRPIVAADWDRVLATLQSLEASGAMPTFTLQTAPPPPPGAASAPPAPGGPPVEPSADSAAPPPPPAGGQAPPPPPPPAGGPPAAPAASAACRLTRAVGSAWATGR